MKNHNEISEFIWNIKEHIRDEYAEKDYEEVILPFTLLRRIDCVLEGTNEKVIEAYEKFKDRAESEVLDFIKKETSKIETLISKYQKQIDLMQEYRTTLICQAVTGKIDVRDWQPH